MKKCVLLTLILTVILLFISCEGFFGNLGGDPIEPQSNKVYQRIVYADYELDLLEARSKIMNIIGPIATVAADSEPELDGEIVFGDTSRSITAKAKAALLSELENNDKYDEGYIIYSEGNNISVYWTLGDMANTAVQSFIEECLDTANLKLDDGIVFKKLYVGKDFIMNGRWDSMKEAYGEELTSAIRSLYNYYDGPKIAGWIANLYDPELGGFYYSRSARDNEGFLPDLESTIQAIAMFQLLGIEQLDTMLPDDIKIKIVNFAKERQSVEDGYFYHPQWPQDKSQLQTDRYGRDQDNAINLIKAFTFDSDGDGIPDMQYPKYCAPNGYKCALHDGTDNTCSFPIRTNSIANRIDGNSPLKVSLTSSVESSASRLNSATVSPTATVSSHPDYSSASAFKAWLEAYNASIGHDSSGNAHMLAALAGEIANKGYGDILIDHLNNAQKELFERQKSLGETPTGIWQTTLDYSAVWGTFKYMWIYNNYNKPINIEYAPYMIRSCIEVLRIAPGVGNPMYNDIMNQWTAITHTINNIKTHYGTDAAETLHDIVRENPVPLIKNTIEKLAPFKIDDGSFCMNPDGTTPGSIYGVPIAVGNLKEGNVNSTYIILNIYGLVCEALGCPKFSLCTQEDGEEVIDMLLTLEPIDKIPVKTVKHDFEGIGGIPQEVSLSRNNADAEINIVSAPSGTGNALLFHSPVGTAAGDGLNISAGGSGSGCYIFDSDMYISSESTENATLLQLMFGGASPLYMMQMQISGDHVNITETSSINNDNLKKIATVPVDDWFNLRIEYYTSVDGITAPEIIIFINEEEIYHSNNFFGSHAAGSTPQSSFSGMYIYSLRGVNSTIYVDNVDVRKSNDQYSE